MNLKFFAASSILLILVFVYGIFFINNIRLENSIIKEENNGEAELLCLSNIGFKIKGACTKENKLELNILNNKDKIDGFIIKIYSSKIEKVSVNEGLDIFESKVLSLGIKNSKIDKVEVFPLIEFSKKLVSCSKPEVYKGISSCSRECSEIWVCAEWSVCGNGRQTRSCVDFNECSTEIIKPKTERVC